MKAKPTRAIEALNEIVDVDRVIAGGLGFARKHDGEPVFVRGAVPGDRVELLALEKHKGFSRAKEYQLTAKSPARRLAPCEYQAQCGGCDLMVLDEQAQRTAKHALVLDVLQRTAKLDASPQTTVPLEWREVELMDTRLAIALGYDFTFRRVVSSGSERNRAIGLWKFHAVSWLIHASTPCSPS